MIEQMNTIRKDLTGRAAPGVAVAGRPVANAYYRVRVVPEAHPPELSDSDLLRVALGSGSVDFWKDPEEDVYGLEDGEPA